MSKIIITTMFSLVFLLLSFSQIVFADVPSTAFVPYSCHEYLSNKNLKLSNKNIQPFSLKCDGGDTTVDPFVLLGTVEDGYINIYSFNSAENDHIVNSVGTTKMCIDKKCSVYLEGTLTFSNPQEALLQIDFVSSSQRAPMLTAQYKAVPASRI